MSSPDGRPVFFPKMWPGHGLKRETYDNEGNRATVRRVVSPSKPSPDDVWVDTTGQFVNSEGEPLNERDWDLSQEDIDQQPKGV